MNHAALMHRPTEEFIYPESEKQLVFRFRAARKDLRTCTLVYWRRYESIGKAKRIPMECVLRDNVCDYFTARAAFQHTACYIRYYFELSDGRQTIWYGAQGVQSRVPETTYFEYLYPNISDGYTAPEWCGRQIYYQIFPERFKNGDTANDPSGTQPWGSAPTRENYMGGDLKGIREGLEHIVRLGATCLYLTPIFTATSNHKYDTVDYFSVDPQFGTETELKELVELCHRRGIKVLLDGVFNHCGYYFPPFQDLLKNGEKSKYRGWFFPESFPVTADPPNYECVGYYKWMPKLNLANAETRDYFIGVGKYWIDRCGIDGWRLDVADEIEGRFWERFSDEIKRENPGTVLIGESWGDASRLVMGNRLDGAMNYLFRDAVTVWLAKGSIGSPEFDHLANRILALYPEETSRRMYNLLDSHDTPRFLYECGGDIRKLKLAAALMMTFPGCPAVFYGDEIGISGANDPDCRQAMQWDAQKQNRELFEWYQVLIEIRRSSEILSLGSYRSNLCSPQTGLYGFIRSYSQKNIYVVFNPTEEEHTAKIPILEKSGKWLELLSGTEISAQTPENSPGYYNQDITKYLGELKTVMPPYSVKILKQKVV
jgi:Glycosidases